MSQRLILKEWERDALRKGATMFVRPLTKRVLSALEFVGGEGDDRDDPSHWGWENEHGEFCLLKCNSESWRQHQIGCPYGNSGDELWLAEPYWPLSEFDPTGETGCFYRDEYLNDPHGPDGEKSPEGTYRKWRPATQMPEHYARDRIIIEAVDVMRVGKINIRVAHECLPKHQVGEPHRKIYDPVSALRERIGNELFNANPFVWVVSYKPKGVRK